MKRHIIIDGEASDWYETATFVLKENREPELPSDLTQYAENILESNLKVGRYKQQIQRINYSQPATKTKVKSRNTPKYIDIFLVVSLCLLSGIVILFLLTM